MRDFYKFHYHNNEVIATTRYAGRTIRATAKCNPIDTFDVSFGEELAKVRCKCKVDTIKYKKIIKKEIEIRNKIRELEDDLSNLSKKRCKIVNDCVYNDIRLSELLEKASAKF